MSDGWDIERSNPVRDGIVAQVNDTCCDDRGHEDEPFQVFVWIKPRHSDGYWSHMCSFPTQGDAENHAQAMASGHHAAKFMGTTRFQYPLP